MKKRGASKQVAVIALGAIGVTSIIATIVFALLSIWSGSHSAQWGGTATVTFFVGIVATGVAAGVWPEVRS